MVRSHKQFFGYVFLALLVTFQAANAGNPSKKRIEFDVERRKTLLKQLGVSDEYKNLEVPAQIGIAIIDDDFGNEDIDRGAYPDNYTIVNSYEDIKGFFDRHPTLPRDKELYPSLPNYTVDDATRDFLLEKGSKKDLGHGLWVIQSVLGVIGRFSQVKFYLLNGLYGENFAAAAYYAKELYDAGLIRTVVNSSTFVSYGAGNGTSPIDKIVEEVTRDPGLVWINAAGNDGEQVWAGTAKRLPHSNLVQFRKGDEGECLRFKSKEGGNNITVSLAWDGRMTGMHSGTGVDYDLEITDPWGNVIIPDTDQTSSASAPEGYPGTIRQRLRTSEEYTTLMRGIPIPPAPKLGGEENMDVLPAPKIPGGTFLPSESITLSDVEKTTNGEYCIHVKAISGTAETDELQVVIRSEPITGGTSGSISRSVYFKDFNRVNDMFPPSTARGVVSTGSIAAYSSKAMNTSGRVRPSVVTQADRVSLNNDMWNEGSSFSAPFIGGVKLLLDTLYPKRKITNTDFTKLLTAAPGPVTLQYVRENHRNGTELVRQLLQLTELTDDQVKCYSYPDGIVVAALPLSPAFYGRVFPKYPQQELNRPDSYDYYFGIRKDAYGATKPFTNFRWKGTQANSYKDAWKFPWEDERLSRPPHNYRPFDIYDQNRTQFEAADFLILEQQSNMTTTEEGGYVPTELKLREGTPRDSARQSYWTMPTKQELRQKLGEFR